MTLSPSEKPNAPVFNYLVQHVERASKLKCCRVHPCTNCRKRGEANSCTFVGRGPRGKTSQGRASPTHVQDRLQHLENLILSLTQQKMLEQPTETNGDGAGTGQEEVNFAALELTNAGEAPFANSTRIHTDDTGTDESQRISGVGLASRPHPLTPEESPSDPPGKLVAQEAGTRYVDGAHWRAVLEEISEVREYLREQEVHSDDELAQQDEKSVTAPTLLLGLHKPLRKEELLAQIPPRPVTDRLVAQWLNCKEPVIGITHIPTFQKEQQYNKFWDRPHEVSLPWLALLSACIAMALAFNQRSGDPTPLSPQDPAEAQNSFRKLTAQCLVQSNYTAPARYKVEALFLYTMSEFLRSDDAQVGVSFLLGITIRLAIRAGYHRDPKHFPDMSAFDGEMRRRVWTILRQLDTLISFQVGVPRTIQDWQHDVELPRNISDEDFDESTEELPPSRPDKIFTLVSYTRAKSRIMTIFGKISDLAYSREPVTYEVTQALDRQLDEAHDQVPSTFKMRPVNQCIADPSDLIFRRYTLELLYLKARCVLHRRYLGEDHNNLRYAYSRWVCMSSSKDILRHQADIHHETQPGGLLYRDRLFPNALQYADYLLAAMIICLELSHQRTGTPPLGGGTNDDLAVVVRGQEELLSALEMSHEIFDKMRRRSADAQLGYAAMTIMLRWVKQQRSGQEDQQQQQQPSISAYPPAYGSWQLEGANSLDAQDFQPMDGVTPGYASLDVIGDMLDMPTNMDWRLWDLQIQGVERPNPGSTWTQPEFNDTLQEN
ncbi:putative C6 transcription factor [Aspergillus brunneoviolaceus CBS 621.78]|uniref:Zn(II)2Cys6 transcription factor n=1 Tax=Aspergillus brunneoviolaceus CBS 621.78 TaxID=1450534 RepID=A0ACD1G486_9EURO|nr:Zn(II)2Cys6 transcription factor [Aspergillus brunneoviolaceus CBS 621.78]RAH44068.1 Zn(II)2Cys6 transcription factor [Aspergillus brunneoviolaceus CBS 621.78]